ncbi:MAG TPA: long-chain fatty acid--CoA ligase [Acetobacteraceae bacterium]|nr:long-chain fatty acid--CoA ligase [Acetobacteraceae bacterium]
MLDTPTDTLSASARPIDTLLREAARAHGDLPAIDFLGRVWKYGELDRLVDRAAKGLQALGVVRGTRVGLCLPNSPYAVIFYFAALRAGGVVVNYNPLYVERELAHGIKDSGTEVMVTIDLKVIYPKLARVAASTGLRKLVVCPMAGALPWLKGLLFPLVRRGDIVAPARDDVTVRYDDVMRNDGKPSPVEVNVHDVAVLQYTGGTTGTPKAACLTHANITCNCAQVIAGMGMQGPERVLGVLPLFHVFALTSVMNLAVRTASLMILVPRFDLDDLLATIARTKPTMFPAVPTIYTALVAAAAQRQVALGSIRLCISGGAPLPVETRQQFMALTKCELMEGYGLSETSPVVSFTPPGRAYKNGSVGIPVVGTVVEIRDPDNPGHLLPAGARGEICIRGPQVMQGYWNKPEETARVMIDGALRTGDIGYLDEDGYLFLVDRIKDVIIAGGYNIYPRMLEEALYQHPAVRDAVVIAVPDAYRGQAPKAFVTLKEGAAVTPDDLHRFLGGYISKIEMPKEIEIRAELPKTLIGKLSKKELVEEEAAKAAQ